MQLKVIDSLDGLEQIQREWSSFADTIPGLTPFQSPEWLLTWWRHFGSGNLHALVFRAGTAIAGIIPLFLHEWQGRRQLTLIGSGVSDYLEPAIAPGQCVEVIHCLHQHLIQNGDWEICNWQDLSAATSLELLTSDPGLEAQICRDTPCSEIRLHGSFEEFWAERSKDLRRNLRRYTQRAHQTGPLEFAVTSRGDGDLTDELIRLHGIRWQKQGGPGMIAANNSADFLREVVREFERLQMTRFFSLRFRDEIVAVSVGFLYRETLYSYLSAFDPRYEILGFGRNLIYNSLRHAYQTGYAAWNFCRGDEPYKFSFGAEPIPKCRLTVTRERSGIS